jgi:hypothetical protein
MHADAARMFAGFIRDTGSNGFSLVEARWKTDERLSRQSH